MAFKFYDRVRVAVASAPGTGAVTLGAATNAFQSFTAAGASSGDTFPYLIVDGNNWEIGVGTYSSSGPTVSRTTITASSSGGSAVSFSANAIVMCAIRSGDIGSGTLAGDSDVSISSPTSGEVLTFNGTAWANAALTGGANPPTLTTFSEQVNASGVSVSTNYVAGKGLTMMRTDTGSGDAAAFLGTAVPGSTPWSVTMQIRQINMDTNYTRTGMGLYNSSSNSLIVSAFVFTNGNCDLAVFEMSSNLSGYGTNLWSMSFLTGAPIPEWFQILFDGTTYTFNISWDGGTWITVTTAAAASYFTATHIGAVIETYGSWSSPSKCGLTILNYAAT